MYSQAILIKKWTFTLLCLSLMACGGSKKFDTPVELTDTKQPLVDSFYPIEDLSEGFEVDDVVELTFDELMDSNSLIKEKGIILYSGRDEDTTSEVLEQRESHITLSIVPVLSNDLITDKEIQIPATKATLTHASGRFALNTSYTVIVDYPSRDLVEDDLDTAVDERNYIATSNLFAFTTQEGNWKAPTFVPNVSIEDDGVNPESLVQKNDDQRTPLILSNPSGDNFVFWRQEVSPGVNQLWGTRFKVNDNKWSLFDGNNICIDSICSNAELINESSTTNVLEYHASINNKGQLAIVWSQATTVGGAVSIWANLYDGNRWLGIKEISDNGLTLSGDADSPQIAIDQDGNVVSVWREQEGLYSLIKTNTYSLNSDTLMHNGQWSEPPSHIVNSKQVLSMPPKLVTGKNSLTVAIWSQKIGENYNIYSNRLMLDKSDDWEGAERIDWVKESSPENGIGDSFSPQIAMDQNGDVIAIWLKYDGQRNNLWYNRFTGSWKDKADYVERDRLGDVSYPIIKFNHRNRALLSWVQENKSTNSKSLLSRFFDVNLKDGWSDKVEIGTSASILKPAAAFDREGNAILMWQDGLAKGNINTKYYSKLTESWDLVKTLSSGGKDVSLAPLYEDGRFLSVWEEESGSSFKLSSALYRD